MASQGPSTRIQPPPPPPPPPPGDSGLDLATLILSAVASAVAAYVTSKLWAPGTLVSAAMSPVIVALVKEGLRKPTEVVTAVVPTPRAARSTRQQRTEPLPGDLTEQLAVGAPAAFPPPQPGAAEGPVRVYSTRGRRLRWRLALITGLLGFGVCVVLYTVPELLAGHSVGRSGRATTLWGGKAHKSKPKPQTTTTGPATTTTKTVTTPAQTTTAPQATTPSPTVTTPPETAPQTTPAAPAPSTATP